MADELDKFVLEYSVQMRDSIARLESLNKKVEETTNKSKQSKKEFEELSAASDSYTKALERSSEKGTAAARKEKKAQDELNKSKAEAAAIAEKTSKSDDKTSSKRSKKTETKDAEKSPEAKAATTKKAAADEERSKKVSDKEVAAKESAAKKAAEKEAKEKKAAFDKENKLKEKSRLEEDKKSSQRGQKLTGAVGRLIPGFEKADGLIKGVGAGFVAAGAAASALLMVVKAFQSMREQYGEQRLQGQAIGIGAIRLEEYQRKFVKQSGGKVTREQTAENIQKLSEFQSAIAQDISTIGEQSKAARVLGLNMGVGTMKSMPINDIMEQLAKSFEKLSDAEVKAHAKVIGVSQDFALSMKAQGKSIGDVTEMTADDVKGRKEADETLQKFNKSFASLNEQFKRASNELSEQLLPALTTFITKISEIVEAVPKFKDAALKGATTKDVMWKPFEFLKVLGRGARYIYQDDKERAAQAKADDKELQYQRMVDAKNKAEAEGKSEEEVLAAVRAAKSKTEKPDGESKSADKQESAAELQSKAAESLNEMVAKEDTENAKAREIADRNKLAINQFVGAVATFANAVDEKQAWAAWAGEIGRAGNLNEEAKEVATEIKAVTTQTGIPQTRGFAMPSKFDEQFKAASEKTGIPVDLLKNIARVESNFNPSAQSEVGAQGLMQVMKANQKAYGINDPFDPAENIMGGARIMKEHLARANGDVRRALTTYHGGYDPKNWGTKTAAYADKVLSGYGDIMRTQSQAAMIEPQKGVSTPVYPPTSAVVTSAVSQAMAQGRTRGESRDTMQEAMVQNTIAQRLGVPLQQLQHGGISRGDVNMANTQLQAGIANNIFNMKNQLRALNLPQSEFAKIATDIQAQQMGLMMMKRFGGGMEAKAREGNKMITVGERAIQINIEGVKTTDETIKFIKEQLDAHIGAWANGTATGMKY